MMGKRQQQKERTRQTIREAAKALFTAQGFEATTSRQIAQQAGVALGTLFVHFPSKQAILADILYEDVETAVFTAFNTLPTHEPTLVQLRHIASVLYANYLKQVELSRTLLQFVAFQTAETAVSTNSSQPNFDTQIATFIHAITDILRQGQQSNDVSQTKEAAKMAEAFMAVYFFVLMGLLRAKSPDLETALDQLENLTELIIN
ncbi:MAG: TetR/AcrR family transcriptional regulator [Chloroflexota bacterium]